MKPIVLTELVVITKFIVLRIQLLALIAITSDDTCLYFIKTLYALCNSSSDASLFVKNNVSTCINHIVIWHFRSCGKHFWFGFHVVVLSQIYIFHSTSVEPCSSACMRIPGKAMLAPDIKRNLHQILYTGPATSQSVLDYSRPASLFCFPVGKGPIFWKGLRWLLGLPLALPSPLHRRHHWRS